MIGREINFSKKQTTSAFSGVTGKLWVHKLGSMRFFEQKLIDSSKFNNINRLCTNKLHIEFLFFIKSTE